ncbi:translation initiation factor IF-2 [Anaerococcus sp. NML200574]|uniref:Translation initiation factor IF-2 n=1 Tax=Anaerococcus kampingae TaxID=3115614 RepID=A0ABW9MEQ0_9FIRM|nr:MULTISPECIES: translation initiation factor IF-2 [unclassified Anaerococcus]MCW6678735.1 translation initiation factor IF-2 [Anaerococcus sp. NML200574]MCW6702091.1 translation initiation factor IF-2 [Anaerococcus sp. NML200537]
MADKIRVYELAKENGMESKEMIKILNEEFNLNIKSHMSMISGEDRKLINEYLTELNEDSSEEAEIIDQKPKAKKPVEKKREKKKIDPKMIANEDDEEARPTGKNRKKKNKKRKSKKNNRQEKNMKAKNESRIEIPETVNVKTFADKLGENPNSVIGKLIGLGIMAGLNDQIDFDTANLIAMDFGKEVFKEEAYDALEEQSYDLDYEDKPENLVERPPVVSVMGHVDHGKTSILDAIRNTSVTRGEAGGITQHIGAYTVDVDGKQISFLDTPGHEAFTEMRMRGAQSTDVAILVVAADDGVMPQTIEAINHAKAAEIPIIVAINKIDKDTADQNRVMQGLMEHGLVPEEWGGDTIMVPVSAHTGQGIKELLEMVLLVAEVRELKANPNRAAVGIIIEAELDKSRGPVATVLVQKGTLHAGDYVVTGSSSGRIRAMFNSKGKPIKEAGPSIPAQILGLSDVAEAGDKIYAVADEKVAREYADRAAEFKREERLIAKANTNLEDMYSDIAEGELKELNIIVKTDVKGTVDAVSTSLTKLSNEEVKVSVIAGAVGGITESDILLAQASNAIIIGFNVRPTQGALERAKDNNIEIRTYSVIYEAIEDVEKAINGMLEPEFKENVLGRAEVRETFKIPGAGTIAGVMVTNGLVTRKSKIRLLRDNIVVFDGEISSMKRFKDDASKLQSGYEGGIGLERFNDVKVGDVMEAYEMVEVERS